MNSFFLNSLNEKFRNQLTLVTNTSRPDLDQFIEKFFEANERYSQTSEIPKSVQKPKMDQESFSPKKTTALAMDINTHPNKSNPFECCPLCPSGSNLHPVHKCTKFPNPDSKLSRLEKLNACTKCTNADHYSKTCRFRFKKQCIFCKGWHFSFLCPKPIPEKTNSHVKINSKKIEDKSDAASKVGLVVTNCNWANYKAESILGTFTCTAGDVTLHGLRDSGSQNNFIVENKLKLFDHEIIDDDVTLMVDGINESKKYSSKLVKINICLGNETKSVEAFTFPSINMSLKLPGLTKIVDAFKSHGYLMADATLCNENDSIENIDLILGADAAFCFKDKTIHFGKQSVFSITQLGVMLIGNIERLLSDLVYLPCCENNSDDGPISIETNVNILQSILPMTCNLGTSSSERTFIPDQMIKSESYELTSRLEKLEDEFLENKCDTYLNKEIIQNDDDVDLNNELVQYLLNNTERTEDGRLVMPLLWNDKVKHLLAHNFKLAKSVLLSNIKKYSKDETKLCLMSENISELESSGIIERIHDIEGFISENPTCSFLPHMPIFKLSKETTKCRFVFLSNLCQKSDTNSVTISHNMAMHSGPCLNQKLTGALMLLRFDRKLLVFDLCKAFCQIQLPESDQNKLLFLWVKNVESDLSIIAYRNVRLSFGLRPSPTILMVALFKILMLDSNQDEERLKMLKRLIYHLIFMDNGAVSMNSSEDLHWAYNQLGAIFNPYGFELQQFTTNDLSLKEKIDNNSNEVSELFGLQWDTAKDWLSTKPKKLNAEAQTKRQILSCIAENFDPYNLECPLMNRARLFMHSLQCRPNLGWDVKLSNDELREWLNICKQLNSAPSLSIPRYVGDRNGEYRLIAFTDASSSIYGTVIYIQCIKTLEVNFLSAKNRIVNKLMEPKTIPALEFAGITLGVETLIDVKNELCGRLSVNPIIIKELHLYTDSLISLNWISQFVNLDKMNKKTVFIQNRLQKLDRLCKNNPITFSFVDGINNPADCCTRPMSYSQLQKTNYLTGPDFLTNPDALLCRADILTITVPDKKKTKIGSAEVTVLKSKINPIVSKEPLLDHSKLSSFPKIINVYKYVFTFVNKIKERVKKKRQSSLNSMCRPILNVTELACNQLLREVQQSCYPEVLEYFNKTKPLHKDMPNLVMQLNLFMDKHDLIRIGGKLNWKSYNNVQFPILLPKNNHVTNLIVLNTHDMLRHAGIFSVLSNLRSKFWIPCCFSTVKKILRQCMHCRRYNNRTLKLSQSPYKEVRLNPSQIPFNHVFIDHAGPFYVQMNNVKTKVYILVITCLFTRAINLKVSIDLTTDEFLRALQLHSFEFGLPSLIVSDMGSSFVAGADIISSFLDDKSVKSHFENNNIQCLKFETYYKGCNKLGSLVESCVKLTKRLLSGSVKNNVLNFRDFEFYVLEAKHLVNRRPIAFKESLRNNGVDCPDPITPEILIYGHELCSVNIIPNLQITDISGLDPDFEPVQRVHDCFKKLRKIRASLIKTYNEEFMLKLLDQSLDDKSRYKKVSHQGLEVGDIVLIKEQNTKPSSYPMARVEKVQLNESGESTGAIVIKGCNREKVKRHASCLIPILQMKECPNISPLIAGEQSAARTAVHEEPPRVKPPRRKAAMVSKQRTKSMLQ